jgi:hypothetical protein
LATEVYGLICDFGIFGHWNVVVRKTVSALLDCVVIKKSSFGMAEMCCGQKVSFSMAEMCHGQTFSFSMAGMSSHKVSFSISGMGDGQKIEFPHGWTQPKPFRSYCQAKKEKKNRIKKQKIGGS